MKETDESPLISVSGLVKRFGSRRCIDGVDLEVMPGEFIALFGPNGAGKTTLLRILAGIQGHCGGAVWRAPGAGDRASTGYISHQTMLYGDLTGRENLDLFARLWGLAAPGDAVSRIIDRVGLGEDCQRCVRDYSRGMMQRLALGRFLISDPSLMILDEPFTGLDSRGTELLSGLLEEARRENRTVILVTHDLRRGYEMADRLLVMARGRLVLDHPSLGWSFDQFCEAYEEGIS